MHEKLRNMQFELILFRDNWHCNKNNKLVQGCQGMEGTRVFKVDACPFTVVQLMVLHMRGKSC